MTFNPRIFNGTIYYNTLNDCSSLPIELVMFDIDCDYIKWATLTETNNDYFIIEKSLDGDEWSSLFMIAGGGNSSKPLSYIVRYSQQNEIEYLRLKQVDYDGNYSYSNVKSNYCPRNVKFYMYYNILGQEVKESYRGIKFKMISND